MRSLSRERKMYHGGSSSVKAGKACKFTSYNMEKNKTRKQKLNKYPKRKKKKLSPKNKKENKKGCMKKNY